jgi:molecular chaperone GrpE
MASSDSADSSGHGAPEADVESTTVLPENPAAPDEADALRLALEAAEEQVRASRDQALRAVAELENVRKRAARDVEQAHRYAVEKLAQELLPVRDSLELAVANAGRGDPASLVAGQEATLKLLAKAFERFSIQVLDPVGEPFDPERHEAMVLQESATAAPDSVLTVVQPGYELNGRLLRPARVIVARAPA